MVARKGDCVSSIAEAHGFFWQTLWDHPRNEALKRARQDPNLLLPGDRVFVPERTPKTIDLRTDALHKFKRKGVPEILRIQFFDSEEEPRADIAYQLTFGHTLREGRTDAEGYLEEWIPPRLKKAKIELLSDDDPPQILETLEVEIGALGPPDSVAGATGRLSALGYLPVNQGNQTCDLHETLYQFQLDHDLAPTGVLDEPTRDALQAAYGS
ncbi:MAG: peptidoglycan-binding protein [Myxococcales bacterium]|nr:peptidoglycan-binding protein [Myxococcales bacterium]